MDPKKSKWTAAAIVHDLAVMAVHIYGGNGIPYALDRNICRVLTTEYSLMEYGQDSKYIINDIIFYPDQSYFDSAMQVVNQLGDVTFRSNRYGDIELARNRKPSQFDQPDWEFTDYIDLTATTLTYNIQDIRNRIIVTSDKGTSMFEHCGITSVMCRGVNRTMSLKVPFADTMEKRKEAARSAFQQMFANWKRKAIGIVGNPLVDIYDIVRVHDQITSDDDLYRILEYKHQFTDTGYLTTLQLEWASNIPSSDIRLITEEFPIYSKRFEWPLFFHNTTKTIKIKMKSTIQKARVNITSSEGIVYASIDVQGNGMIVSSAGQPILSPTTVSNAQTFQATAYNNPDHNLTANGSTTVQGTTIAVDPSVIPLGSAVRITVTDAGFTQWSGDYIAQDTGGAIVGNIIDIYMDSSTDAINWGRRNVTLSILNSNPTAKSIVLAKDGINIRSSADANLTSATVKKVRDTGFTMDYLDTVGSFYKGKDPEDGADVYVWADYCTLSETSGNTNSATVSPSGGPGSTASFVNLAVSKVGDGYVWGARGEMLSPSKLTYFENTYGYDHYHAVGPGADASAWLGKQVFDCGGLVIWCLRQLNLLSSSQDYDAQGIFNDLCAEIARADIQPGDLFFRQEGGAIYHVGIVVSTTQVVEAKGTYWGVVLSDIPQAERWGRIRKLQTASSYNGAPDANATNVVPTTTLSVPTSYTITSNYDKTKAPTVAGDIATTLNGNLLFYWGDCVLYNVGVDSDGGTKNELVLYWSPITSNDTTLDLGYEVLIY
jgi:3D (Asp-Asp-Asp) domain-containing protein